MSLLTQFYDCPSGGSSGPTDFSTFQGGFYAGATPYIIFVPLDGVANILSSSMGILNTPTNASINIVASDNFPTGNGGVGKIVTWSDTTMGNSSQVIGPLFLQSTFTSIFSNITNVKSIIAVNVTFYQSGGTGAELALSNTLQKISGGGWGSDGPGFLFNAPSLVTIENAGLMNIRSSGTTYSNLENIETCTFMGTSSDTVNANTLNFVITGAKLTVASVEKVLADVRKIKTAQPATTGTVNLSSGTSAGYSALSAQGQADYNYLVGAGGMSMTLNA